MPPPKRQTPSSASALPGRAGAAGEHRNALCCQRGVRGERGALRQVVRPHKATAHPVPCCIRAVGTRTRSKAGHCPRDAAVHSPVVLLAVATGAARDQTQVTRITRTFPVPGCPCRSFPFCFLPAALNVSPGAEDVPHHHTDVNRKYPRGHGVPWALPGLQRNAADGQGHPEQMAGLGVLRRQ